jgi:prepilin-type processing-associated H-X9-DG protein
MLAVVAIVTLTVSIALPALSAARSSAKTLVCSSNLKTVTLEFALFAEGESATGRGESEKLGRGRFRIGDFQESVYGLHEFWDAGEQTSAALRGKSELMACPASGGPLTKRKGFPCGSAAIGPVEDVSLGMNMRLHRAAVSFKGKTVLSPVASTYLHAGIMRHPYVPLIMDVDGAEADRQGREPFYLAPSLPDTQDPFSDDRYWTPSPRHGRKTNVGFVGGHVLTSPEPQQERWDWAYQADTGR